MTISKTIAVAVRHYRERQGLSQAELARRMKVQDFPWHPMTVQRTETAERPLRLDEAVALAGVLDVKVQDLYALPEVSDPEVEQLRQELERAYADFHDARMSQMMAAERVAMLQGMEKRAREIREAAEREYMAVTHDLRAAEASLSESESIADHALGHLDVLRSHFERMQRRKQQAALLRSLRPGEEVRVTIENVEPAKTRFIKRPDGVIFELVNKDDEVVLRSDPFENEQIAKEQAAFFLDRYARGRHKKSTPGN